MHWIRNRSAAFGAPVPVTYSETLGRAAALEARRYFQELFDYHPTPMWSLAGLAQSLGVAGVQYKDESYRLGLQSFKALGGAYAVARMVRRHAEELLGREISLAEMASGVVRRQSAELTVACATDGNHGRSVAWGARRLGCSCVIFLHEHVSKLREEAIAAFGARIIRVPGVYDDSCAEASRMSRQEGWKVVSDFSSEPYHEVTSWVMQGYGVMMEEILAAFEAEEERPTHVFVQGGCGGLAAAVAGHCASRLPKAPTVVVVEPERANCLLESARKAEIVRIAASQPTCMSMLECYEPSHMAWPILERTAALFMDLPDEAAIEAGRRLAQPCGNDPVLHAGASGAAGVAGLIAASADPGLREAAGLDAQSRILVIGSEGLIE